MLQSGDVLLYGPKGFFGKVIAFKTWHPIAHVEVYIGDDHAVASRDGQGVGLYVARTGDIKHVLRPNVPLDLVAALHWFETVKGQPYGWMDLLQFAGFGANGKGMVCSPCATEFLRAGGVPVFGNEPAIKIAPFQFLLSELLTDVTAAVSV